MRVALVLIAVLLGVACAYATQQWMEVKTRVDVAERTASMHQHSYEYEKGRNLGLQEQLNDAETAYRYCEDAYTELKLKYEEQVEARQQAFLDFYYPPIPIAERDREDLETFLSLFTWIPIYYSQGYFDCSEIAAYMEWCLENAGFDTRIQIKEDFAGRGGHAWLIVRVPGTYTSHSVVVEATVPQIVTPESEYHKDYMGTGIRTFDDITEAMAVNPYEFDWWTNWAKWTD